MDFGLLIYGDEGWGDEMLRGALMTIAIASCSYLLGIFLASGIAAMKLSRHFGFRIFADSYTTIIRGIPELLIIYLVYYGGSGVLGDFAKAVFGYDEYINLPVFFVGMFCIGVSSAAYSAEVIRGAVLAVPIGQIEAARAVGMNKSKRLFRILIPQIARFALPGLGNVWQLTLKETSLISIIGLVDIMRHGSIASGSTKEPFTFYLTAFVLYLLLTSISNRGFLRAETWANKGVRTS